MLKGTPKATVCKKQNLQASNLRSWCVWTGSKQACPCLLKLWDCSHESLCFSCVSDELWRHFTGKGDSWQFFFFGGHFYLLLDSDRWRAKQEVGRGMRVTCNREPAWIELTTSACSYVACNVTVGQGLLYIDLFVVAGHNIKINHSILISFFFFTI